LKNIGHGPCPSTSPSSDKPPRFRQAPPEASFPNRGSTKPRNSARLGPEIHTGS
jgi:hypothetical protein